jgi:hypothetical protein
MIPVVYDAGVLIAADRSLRSSMFDRLGRSQGRHEQRLSPPAARSARPGTPHPARLPAYAAPQLHWEIRLNAASS